MFLGRIDLIINLFTFSKNSANFNIYFKIILLFFFSLLNSLQERFIVRIRTREFTFTERKRNCKFPRLFFLVNIKKI